MIGAGIGQIFLARKIKERGDYLITITLPGNQPVIDIADKVYYHDVFDQEGVLKIAKEEKIDGVISDQNDTLMPTVAYVSEGMNLSGLRINQVNAYCNKNVYRDNCDKLNIPVPKHTKVSAVEIPAEFKEIPFPWMVKPADSQSSIGVAKVNNEEEYFDAIDKALGYSKTNTAILEEFFSGQELVAEGFIYHGKYYNLGFADRKYFDLENKFIPSQTIFPSVVNKHVLEMINSFEERMANYINPEFAIVHSEYLYNSESREIRVVESALRGGGVYISSHLVPYYSGIDINDVLLDCMNGNDVDMNTLIAKHRNLASAYVCFYLPEGVITNVEGLEQAAKFDFVKMICISDVKVGDITPPLTHKGQRLGPIIVTGKNKADIENNIKIIQSTIKITVICNYNQEHKINWE